MELSREQELFQQVILKAWEDAEFKKELVANPLDAIEKVTGQRLELPEGKKLVVRDQTDKSKFYINIPEAANTNEDVELNEEQLEAVAGGCQWGDSSQGGVIDPFNDYLDKLKDFFKVQN